MKRGRVRDHERLAGCAGASLLLVAGLISGCASQTKPGLATGAEAGADAVSEASRAGQILSRYEEIRTRAYSPRRFKALYKGDVSPTIGMIARGYLLLWWDGTTMIWKTSAPLAGTGRMGALRLGSTAGTSVEVPFPGGLTERDAIGVLLGVLDIPAAGRTVETSRSGFRIVLDAEGRAASVDAEGRVTALELGGETRVEFSPGEGVPRRIDARGRDGRAKLSLESYGPWPEGEPIP